MSLWAGTLLPRLGHEECWDVVDKTTFKFMKYTYGGYIVLNTPRDNWKDNLGSAISRRYEAIDSLG